jgi:hypothetical protein
MIEPWPDAHSQGCSISRLDHRRSRSSPNLGKGEVGRLAFPEVVYKHADLMAKITVKRVYVV